METNVEPTKLEKSSENVWKIQKNSQRDCSYDKKVKIGVKENISLV